MFLNNQSLKKIEVLKKIKALKKSGAGNRLQHNRTLTWHVTDLSLILTPYNMFPSTLNSDP